MAKSQEIKEKLIDVADDLRKIADDGHPHAGHLQEEAKVIEKAAETCETVLNHPAPVGKSGQGATLPEDEKKKQQERVKGMK